ncbi:MAG: ATP-binding protein [Chloroflexi bacterium]|nr:ATP-binding protein [Chloroflexota bacterium]
MTAESLSSILQRIMSQREARLQAAGEPAPDPPADATSASCPDCHGHGLLEADPNDRRPDKYPKYVPCKCQQPHFEAGLIERLQLYSNLGHLRRFTFGTLREDNVAGGEANLALFRDACRAAAAFAEKPEGWLVLNGPPGSGKTHLAASIANHLMEGRQIVLFMSAPDLLDQLRSGYAPTSDIAYSDIYERVAEAPILILDALGTHHATPWAQEKLQQLISHRFNAELPTVFTTASNLSDLDPHIRVRLEHSGFSRVVPTAAPSPTQNSVGPSRLPHPPMLARMTFESFRGEGNRADSEGRASLQDALKAAETFASNPEGWLLLYGPTGVGKTHLAVAITARLIEAGRQPYYVRTQQLIRQLGSTFARESSLNFDRLFAAVSDAPLLILDDLGAESDSDWTRATLQDLITHRHDARLPTVVTTTVQMPLETGPIATRICDRSLTTIVRISAPNYRMKR